MPPRKIVLFLIKLFPTFFLVLYIWHGLGLAGYYHQLIGNLLNWAYTTLDPHGFIKGIDLEGRDFIVKIMAYGRKMSLEIVAEDVTTNEAMLLTLYLVSPILPRWRRFLGFFLSALAALFLVHVLTVASIIHYALLTNPTTARLMSPNALSGKLAAYYNNFYELMGMYLFVLALWLPHVLLILTGARRSIHEKGPPG